MRLLIGLYSMSQNTDPFAVLIVHSIVSLTVLLVQY